MNIELIRARVREAFQPFAVVMSSGNKYPVPHPDFIFITARMVIVADTEGYATHLDPMHIVGLEDIPARGSQGRKQRQKR